MTQHAFATSTDALSLMAETQTVMAAVRSQSPDLPADGNVIEMDIGNKPSFEVLSAPRSCEVHVGNQNFTMNLTPQDGVSIQDVASAALKAAAPASSTVAKPKFDPGMGTKK